MGCLDVRVIFLALPAYHTHPSKQAKVLTMMATAHLVTPVNSEEAGDHRHTLLSKIHAGDCMTESDWQ